MYYAMDHCHQRDTSLADPVYCRRLNASLLHGRVERVAAAVHRLHLADGREVAYDRSPCAEGPAVPVWNNRVSSRPP